MGGWVSENGNKAISALIEVKVELSCVEVELGKIKQECYQIIDINYFFGWVAGEIGNRANSASIEVEIELRLS